MRPKLLPFSSFTIHYSLMFLPWHSVQFELLTFTNKNLIIAACIKTPHDPTQSKIDQVDTLTYSMWKLSPWLLGINIVKMELNFLGFPNNEIHVSGFSSEDGSRHVPPKRRFVINPHGATS
jgi:hypothetical protein